MKRWGKALHDALFTGSVSSIASTLALALRGRADTGSPWAATNAISHWVWGDRDARRDEPDGRHTLLGYAIHHAASIFWAVFYERWFGDRAECGDVPAAIVGGGAVAGLACIVDYRLTPHRLEPGFETRLSPASLFAVYWAVGAGLVLGNVLLARIERPGPSAAPGAAWPPARHRHARTRSRCETLGSA